LKSKEAVKSRLKADGEKNHWEAKRRKLEDGTRQLRTECQELEVQYQVRTATWGCTELTSFQTWLTKAQDYCDRVETERGPAAIRKEIENMEQALQAREVE